MMSEQKYSPCPQDGCEDSESNQLMYTTPGMKRNSHKKLLHPRNVVLFFSLCLNVALMVWLSAFISKREEIASKYGKHLYNLTKRVMLLRKNVAGLTHSTTSAWEYRNEYYSHNRTQSDALWEAINFDSGIIALTDEESAELGLPQGERFPWDENKGLYLINGYHNLHCLVSVMVYSQQEHIDAHASYRRCFGRASHGGGRVVPLATSIGTASIA